MTGGQAAYDSLAVSYVYDEFLATVQTNAGISREQADQAARATLQTLAERLSAGEARDLAAQLPPELAPYLAPRGDAQGFDVQEFLRRVAEREGVNVASAQRHARGVFAALGRAVGRDEIEDMAAELPEDYQSLVSEAAGRFFEVTPADEFLRRVAERAGIDAGAARRATEAVLETLAERVAGGEVADLLAQLPVELHAPLRRGSSRTRKAARMSLDDFVERVAEREGIDAWHARGHVSAVFETLREALDRRELLDLTAQLPAEYAAVGMRP